METQATVHVVPAQPGFFVLECGFEDDLPITEPRSVYCDQTPVLAWVIEITAFPDRGRLGITESHAVPITLYGSQDGAGVVVLDPTGAINDLFRFTFWDSVEDYKNWWKRDAMDGLLKIGMKL